MSNRFKEARLLKKIKLIDAAKMLEVSQPALSSWESGRKAPSLDKLINMANLYGVTTDYLLGNDLGCSIENSTMITKQMLPFLHGKPVWVPQSGWALVNAIDNIILLTNGEHLKLDEVDNLLLAPERFSDTSIAHGTVLSYDELFSLDKIWLEPISKDFELRQELRGWYYMKGCFVENELGNRFSLSSYGAKWLAFKDFLK